MAKRSETFEHTADLGLSAWGDTAAELFEALAEGLARIICPDRDGRIRDSEQRTVQATAEEVELLAVDFLCEVLGMIEVERFMIATARVTELTDGKVTAELHGEPYDPARHEIETEVKAVTYHRVTIALDDGGWIGRVVLDL